MAASGSGAPAADLDEIRSTYSNYAATLAGMQQARKKVEDANERARKQSKDAVQKALPYPEFAHEEQVDIYLYNRMIVLAQPKLEQGGAIFDFACGGGRFLALLREKGYAVNTSDPSALRAVGVDLCEAMLNLAPPADRGFLVCGDITRLDSWLPKVAAKLGKKPGEAKANVLAIMRALGQYIAANKRDHNGDRTAVDAKQTFRIRVNALREWSTAVVPGGYIIADWAGELVAQVFATEYLPPKPGVKFVQPKGTTAIGGHYYRSELTNLCSSEAWAELLEKEIKPVVAAAGLRIVSAEPSLPIKGSIDVSGEISMRARKAARGPVRDCELQYSEELQKWISGQVGRAANDDPRPKSWGRAMLDKGKVPHMARMAYLVVLQRPA